MDDASIDRRTVLRWMAIGTTALAGCSTSRGGDGGAPTTRRLVSTTTATEVPRPVAWNDLGEKLSGRLVLPSASSYLTDLRLFDPRFDSGRPAAIAFCADPTDVQRSIEFARTNNVPFTARSGGHSYAGYSTSTGLVIDVTMMNAVTLDGDQATIGSGARLIDFYTSLNDKGVSIPAGSCPSVGIAGLALGGGIGVVARRHGLTCDAMNRVQIVTADSRLVTADATRNDDLYWACRGGGGGNFGIATGFDFATFPTGDVALFTLRWPWAAASDLLAAWLDWIAGAPDALWSNCILATGAPVPMLQVAGIWMGAQPGVAPLLDQLVATAGAAPSTRFLETIPLAHAMYVEAGCAELSESECHVTGQTSQARLPRGPSFAGSSFVDAAPTDAGIAAIVGGISQRIDANQPGAIAFDSYGGAINRVPAAATAFVHRNSLCCAQYSVSYPTTDSASTVQRHQQWIETYGAAIRPYVSSAAYQNYIDPALPNSLQAYYGTNLPRLQTVKKKWDADDVFHFAQGIPRA